jgi:hypothetical protein
VTWVGGESFVRRPLLFVEDRLYHIDELLRVLAAQAPELVAWATMVCLDRPGPDTTRHVSAWLAAYPRLQVMAAQGEGAPGEHSRYRGLEPEVFRSAPRLCAALAGALRAGGVLLQDVQLETLTFLSADRWWDSIYLASTIRGMFPDRPPLCRFVSNKKSFAATFGRDLLEAGFDPREVMDKRDLEGVVVPVLRDCLARAFPFRLAVCAGGVVLPELPLARAPEERLEVEAELDLVLWEPGEGGPEIGGRAFERARPRVGLRAAPQEGRTWERLFAEAFHQGSGMLVLDVGQRLLGADSERAEQSNAAARHLHALRARLRDDSAILTADHAYRLNPRLLLGWVRAAS